MSTCPYDSIPVGAHCHTNITNWWCDGCKTPFRDGAYRMVYRGPFTDGESYHLFEFVIPMTCPDCGHGITCVTPKCTGGDVWPSFVAAEKLEAPQ